MPDGMLCENVESINKSNRVNLIDVKTFENVHRHLHYLASVQNADVMIAIDLVIFIFIGLVAISNASDFLISSNCFFDMESADMLEVKCDGILNIGPIIDDFVSVSDFLLF